MTLEELDAHAIALSNEYDQVRADWKARIGAVQDEINLRATQAKIDAALEQFNPDELVMLKAQLG